MALKNTINDHLEHHVLNTVAQEIFFFPFISGKCSFLKTAGLCWKIIILIFFKKKVLLI